MTLADLLAFPEARPPGYAVLEREPTFDPRRHLALEMPETIISLQELGYPPEEIDACPTTLGITSCLRVLSDEGVACLLEVVRSLAFSDNREVSAARLERIADKLRRASAVIRSASSATLEHFGDA